MVIYYILQNEFNKQTRKPTHRAGFNIFDKLL